MKTAEEKFPDWDKQRVERLASGAGKETQKMMSKLSKSYKDLGPEDEDLIKRKAGDSIN
jgi:arsenate reductase-like glutaredoxin family protein